MGNSEFRERRLAAADGVSIALTEAGDPDAPAVILLHGGGQTRHAWTSAVRRLAGSGYHAVSIDLRGHGDSDWSPSGDYEPEAFGRDLASIVRQIGKPAAVVGASMGGQAAIRAIASDRSSMMKALVLVDIVPRPARAGVRKVTKFMQSNLHGFANLDEVADAVAAYNPNRRRPDDVAGLLKNVRLREDGRYYWHWDPRILNMGDTEEKLDAMEEGTVAAMSRVRVPSLLVRGGASDVVDSEVSEEFRRHMPDIEIRVVAGAGHMVAGDRNDAFNEAVIEFLSRRHV